MSILLVAKWRMKYRHKHFLWRPNSIPVGKVENCFLFTPETEYSWQSAYLDTAYVSSNSMWSIICCIIYELFNAECFEVGPSIDCRTWHCFTRSRFWVMSCKDASRCWNRGRIQAVRFRRQQGWHIGGILPITDMPILICHNRYIGRYPSLNNHPCIVITDIAYRPICIGSNDYRYRYIGFADMGYIGRYFVSADTDMPTLVGRVPTVRENQWKSGRICPGS